MRRSRRTEPRTTALAPVLALTLILNGTPLVMAQTASPTPNAAAPAVRTLTLADVVNLAITHNPSAALARQRLQRAQELITQVDAQSRPQINATLDDTYSSQKTFGAGGAANVANPTLPGGGVIPNITDAGGGNTATLTTGGGGGTSSSNGSITTTGGTSTPAAGSGSSTATSGASVGTVAGGISSSSTANAGGAGAGAGTGTFGTTGPGFSAGGGGAGPQDVRLEELPPIARQYAVATGGGSPAVTTASAQAVPHDTTPPSGSSSIPSGSSGYYNNYSGRLTLSQYLDVFGLVPAARDVEKITRDFYRIDLERVSNELALTAKNDFFNVLRDQAQVGVYQAQVTAATENVRIARAGVTAGSLAPYDLLTAQVTLSNDQQALSAAQNQLNLATANLDNLLNIDPSTPLNLQPPPLPSLDQSVDLQASTQLALHRRPELLQAGNNLTIARKLIRLAGATLLPTVGVAASANYNGNATPGSPNDTYSVTAQVSVPLYDGGNTRSKVRQSQIDLQTQQTTLDQLQQNVQLEVRQAYLNISDAQVRAGSAALGTQQAQQASNIARLRYQNGLGTILDVINAEAQFAQAQTNQLNAQYDYQTSLAQLVRAVGGR